MCSALRPSLFMGGDVALNSLLITSLSLKLPLKNPTALKNLEMAKLRVSFSYIDLIISLLIRNQEESQLRRLMSKS